MPIRELRVSGYRSIRDLRVCFNKVNVLTCPNGCGKSNLYNAVFLLAKTATGGFARVIAAEGGMPSVLWAGEHRSRGVGSSRAEPLRMTLGVKTDCFSYEMSCGLVRTSKESPSAFRLDPEIKEERVWTENGRAGRLSFFERGPSGIWVRDSVGKRVSYSGKLIASEGVFSQLREPHLYPELSALRAKMENWRFYHHFRTDNDSPLRKPQIGIQTPVLSHNGDDLAAALQTILEVGDAEQLQNNVASAFQRATLIIESSKAGFSVLIRMPGLKRPLDSSELSDGTLRYLCLLAALLSPRPPALLALNEPETSLHPDLFEGLARLITTASRHSQLWITTHSPRLAELIERFSREPNVRLELVDGETRIVGQKLVPSVCLEPSEEPPTCG